MIRRLVFLAACFAWTTSSPAQSPAPEQAPPPSDAPGDSTRIGFLDLFNGTGAHARIRVEGRDLIEGGLPTGQNTGGLVLPAKSHLFRFEVEGLDPQDLNVPVTFKQTSALAFSIRTEKNQKTGKITRRVLLSPLGGEAGEDKYRLWIRNFLDADVSMAQFGEKPLALKRDELLEIPGYNGEAFRFGLRGQEGQTFRPSEPGSLVAALYPDGKGGAAVFLLRRLNYSVSQ